MTKPVASRRALSQPNWNSTLMSAIAGATAHFDFSYTAPELFVESSFFAITNVQLDLKPCGPYCWDHRPVMKNLASMGVQLTWLHSPLDCKSTAYRKDLFEQISTCDDDTIVGMAGLEYQLLRYQDEQKLMFTLPWGPEVPTCVKEMSISDYLAGKCFPGTGWFTLKRHDELARTTRLRRSITSALAYYLENASTEQSEYSFGPVAWKHWAAKLEDGSYDKHGHWWTSMVWSEARRQAAVYFDQYWSKSADVGKELSARFENLAALISKSAADGISDSERAECIRQAQEIDLTIYQDLVECDQVLQAIANG